MKGSAVAIRNERTDNEGNVVYLYKVNFGWQQGYNDWNEGIQNLTVVVAAISQFTALAVAWELLSPLGLQEPTSFDVKRKTTCDS